ncbi:MAG: Ribosomal protein L11 methyltransferase [Turneriella sp.]|nr:Ribosomal protein L11 methyltransferase [Turneriella sp.]
MNYLDTVFWEVSLHLPKESTQPVENFFLKAGALSSYELLYAEGKTHNLTEDYTHLFFFFEKSFPVHAFIPMALATLHLPDTPFQITKVEYRDYLKEFEKTFKAFSLTLKTALVPPWDAENAEIPKGSKKLYLVPGLAFGTGKHSTTQLMVEFLEETVRTTDTIIDMGTGSGILAICALLWGAQKVIGFDVETLAVESANTNLKLNQEKHNKMFNAKFSVGDFSSLASIKPDPSNTVFVANILPNIFEANATFLKTQLASSRVWALSGIPCTEGNAFGKFLKNITDSAFSTREKEDWLIFFSVNV